MTFRVTTIFRFRPTFYSIVCRLLSSTNESISSQWLILQHLTNVESYVRKFLVFRTLQSQKLYNIGYWSYDVIRYRSASCAMTTAQVKIVLSLQMADI